jgi:SMC interacting uncharacterized protein involved in chromosome segregation
VTQAIKRTPADVLREARRRDSDRKRNQVFRAVDAMKRDGTPITFASVARSAKVSQWLVYAEGVRGYIEDARNAQADEPMRHKSIGHIASDASLRTDLEFMREHNRRLREEITRLKQALRGQLGEQLESQSNETLRQRIDQLTEANDRYGADNAELQAELAHAREQLQTTQDDLAAARTSLRRMIREQTLEISP